MRTKGRINGLNADKSVDLKFSLIPSPFKGGAVRIASAADIGGYC
jgi:hypothetical protein